MAMKSKRRGPVGAFLLAAFLVMGGVAEGEEASLRAEELRYDPAFQQIRAQGDVVLRKGGMAFDAQEAEGFLAEGRYRLWGGVRGRSEERNVDVEAESLSYREEGGLEVVAEGAVSFRRGDDELRCARLLWRESGLLHATGGVEAFSGPRAVEADEGRIDGDAFRITGLKRYEDAQSGLFFRAAIVEGKLKGGVVVEVTASGSVEARLTGADGGTLRIVGAKALYSQARGTLVVSGSAVARQGERTLRADSLVLHLASRRIEALGSPKITFSLPERGTP